MGSRGQASGLEKLGDIYRIAEKSKEFLISLRREEDSLRSGQVEKAIILDKDGNILFTESQGDESEVRFTKEQCVKMKDANLTHNHPNGTTFSVEDLRLLIHARLASIRVVTNDAEYELQRLGKPSPKRKRFAEEYNLFQQKVDEAADKEWDTVLQQYFDGKITQEECEKQGRRAFEKINLEYSNWLRKNAKRYGYRYSTRRR